MMGRSISVGLVDDHRMLIDGLRSIIRNAAEMIDVIGEAGNAIDAAAMVEAVDPDILVTDISMPGLSGLQLAANIAAAGDRPRVIVLSTYKDADIVERAVKAGVWGYLLKADPAGTLIDAITVVHGGGRYFSPSIPREMITGYRCSGDTLETELTRRQLEVVGLICEGKTEREIAEELEISHHTAHVHKNNILQTLHLHSKVDIVKYAVQRGVVQL